MNDEFYLVYVHALELLFEINGGCTVIVERSAVNDSTEGGAAAYAADAGGGIDE